MPDENPYAAGYPSEYAERNPLDEGGWREPLPERTQGVNFAYRGGEQHGVPVENVIDVSPDQWEGGYVALKDEEEEPTPVPVRIVSESSNEQSKWRAFQYPVTGSLPVLIVGRMDRRTNLKIRNLHATATAYVGPDASTSSVNAWPLPPGAEFTISGEGEVWAIPAVSTDVVTLAVLTEYTVG